jgi:hypothetical protein
MVASNLQLPTEPIDRFCRRWKVTEMSLFGSVLRADFRPDSDVDVLVTFAADATWSVFDLIQMEEELSVLLERKVDLLERRAVEQSENYIRRRHILSTAEPVYVAR